MTHPTNQTESRRSSMHLRLSRGMRRRKRDNCKVVGSRSHGGRVHSWAVCGFKVDVEQEKTWTMPRRQEASGLRTQDTYWRSKDFRTTGQSGMDKSCSIAMLVVLHLRALGSIAVLHTPADLIMYISASRLHRYVHKRFDLDLCFKARCLCPPAGRVPPFDSCLFEMARLLPLQDDGHACNASRQLTSQTVRHTYVRRTNGRIGCGKLSSLRKSVSSTLQQPKSACLH